MAKVAIVQMVSSYNNPMPYQTIYQIATTPSEAVKQILLNRLHEQDAIMFLIGVPVITMWIMWMKRSSLQSIILTAISGEIILVAIIGGLSVALAYSEHISLAKAYVNQQCEKIEGQISGLDRATNYAGKGSFQAAHFWVNGKEINFSTRNPGFNNPFDENIHEGAKVRIWLTGDKYFKQVIDRLDVAKENNTSK